MEWETLKHVAIVEQMGRKRKTLPPPAMTSFKIWCEGNINPKGGGGGEWMG